jgi:hypothetical protein
VIVVGGPRLSWLVVAACALGAVAGGCSNGKPSSGAGRGGSNGGSSAGGSTGAGGVVGAGGVSAGAGGAGGSTTLTAEQVCHDAMVAQCERLEACAGSAPAGCDAIAERCPLYYFGPHTLRTLQNVADCIPKLRAATCTDIIMGINSYCLAGGTRAVGEPCSGASECQSGHCSGYWPSCGTCLPGLALGDSCGTGAAGSCPPGSYCPNGTRVCTTVTAVAHANLGEPCDLSANPPVGCAGDLYCKPTVSTMSAGTCANLPQQGEPCASGGTFASAQCGAGLRCGRTTTNQAICGDPEPCGSVSCDATSACAQTPTTALHCAPYATEGQPCTVYDPNGDVTCVSPLSCTGEPTDAALGTVTLHGTCAARGGPGDPCGPGVGSCREAFLCTNGACTVFDPASCTAPADAGGQ